MLIIRRKIMNWEKTKVVHTSKVNILFINIIHQNGHGLTAYCDILELIHRKYI